MLDEISQYSDIHHQKYQDYGSVEQLMHSFFEALSEKKGQSFPAVLRPMNDGTETGRNRPLSKDLFESDIVLTVDQLKGIVLAERDRRLRKSGNRRVKRKVITGAVYRCVPPLNKIQNLATWKELIRSALKFWESETCVRWEENGPGVDRVVFFRVVVGICDHQRIVAHEVGHSLGFWHEQSRPDRDDYIRVIKKYIASGTEGNFVKRTALETDDMGVPFDLGSVMHYGPMAFTTDWSHITIETKDPKYSHTIGQRAKPSFIDVKQVNRLYYVCGNSPLACGNGGYPDPNNCNICKCPTGLGGQLIFKLHISIALIGSCGGELTATDEWKELAFKGGKSVCYWRIKTGDKRIRLRVDSVSLRCDVTCRNFVEIKHNSDFQQTGFRICCSEDSDEVISEQNEVLIIYDSMDLDYEGGFTLRYVKDTGKPLPKRPAPQWVRGRENRSFRGLGSKAGPIEKFIVNAIPQIRDPKRPIETIASIVTDFTVGQLLGVSRD
ncbi:unnamed protein product [Enterobius vermicularis]|uniref:Metalloendopeptidase n=1 Tax=Enterobius vermicularis TaxID=51028 RepID=A0A0N4VD26_ENTVE|nr:unnamed protein product [Enterobius vermicularis]